MSESPKAVFLSYASQDADVVGRMADALRAWPAQPRLRSGLRLLFRRAVDFTR